LGSLCPNCAHSFRLCAHSKKKGQGFSVPWPFAANEIYLLIETTFPVVPSR